MTMETRPSAAVPTTPAMIASAIGVFGDSGATSSILPSSNLSEASSTTTRSPVSVTYSIVLVTVWTKRRSPASSVTSSRSVRSNSPSRRIASTVSW